VKTRSRKSRIVAGIALFAASAAVSSAMLGAGWTIAEFHTSPAIVSAVPMLVTRGPLSPLPSIARRPLSAVRPALAARARASASVAGGVGVARTLWSGGMLGGLIVVVAFGWWLLGFARKSSRTRGQPRGGVLVV
jgi:hypothetical protein